MRARSPRSGRSLRREPLSPSYRLATRVPLVDRRPRIRTCFDITPQRAGPFSHGVISATIPARPRRSATGEDYPPHGKHIQ